MLEFVAGYLLASGSKSQKPKEPMTAEQEKHLIIARSALFLAMAATLGVAVTMIAKGPGWNPTEAFLSYVPSGWLFWIASGVTAIITGFLALVQMPLAGILFRLTIMVMTFAAMPVLATLIIP